MGQLYGGFEPMPVDMTPATSLLSAGLEYIDPLGHPARPKRYFQSRSSDLLLAVNI
jgi:hypothetical protein